MNDWPIYNPNFELEKFPKFLLLLEYNQIYKLFSQISKICKNIVPVSKEHTLHRGGFREAPSLLATLHMAIGCIAGFPESVFSIANFVL